MARIAMQQITPWLPRDLGGWIDLAIKIGPYAGGFAVWLGLSLAPTPQYRLAGWILVGMCICLAVLVVARSLPVAPGWLVRNALPVATAIVGVAAVLALAALFSTYYGPQVVDRLGFSQGQAPAIRHLAFDESGAYVVVDAEDRIRVKDLGTGRESTTDWPGLDGDAFTLTSDGSPKLTIARLGQANVRLATIWTWDLLGVPEPTVYGLAPNSNTDPSVACKAQDVAPDSAVSRLAIAYTCWTKVTQKAAGGFVELAPLATVGTEAALPTPMRGPTEFQVAPPGGPNCYPKQVSIDDASQHVIGVYDCLTVQAGSDHRQHSYHVERWGFDGAFDSWSPMPGLDNKELMSMQPARDGGRLVTRVVVRNGASAELWQPMAGEHDRRISWIDFDPVTGFSTSNVALSADGRWIADLEIRDGQSHPQPNVALQQFGVWVGRWHAALLDRVWPMLLNDTA